MTPTIGTGAGPGIGGAGISGGTTRGGRTGGTGGATGTGITGAWSPTYIIVLLSGLGVFCDAEDEASSEASLEIRSGLQPIPRTMHKA